MRQIFFLLIFLFFSNDLSSISWKSFFIFFGCTREAHAVVAPELEEELADSEGPEEDLSDADSEGQEEDGLSGFIYNPANFLARQTVEQHSFQSPTVHLPSALVVEDLESVTEESAAELDWNPSDDPLWEHNVPPERMPPLIECDWSDHEGGDGTDAAVADVKKMPTFRRLAENVYEIGDDIYTTHPELVEDVRARLMAYAFCKERPFLSLQQSDEI